VSRPHPTPSAFRRVQKLIGCLSFWAWATVVLGSPLVYWGVLNALGPSTEYHDPYITGARRLDDGRYEGDVGDRVFVRYTIIRHATNGDCTLQIHRYGENVGGPEAGDRKLLDYAEVTFRGRDELRHPRWPSDGLVLTSAMIPHDLAQQELALYAVVRYYCNPLDYLFPRYIQGGVNPNQTERVYIIVKRRAP
jgi:hypothetical protein